MLDYMKKEIQGTGIGYNSRGIRLLKRCFKIV
jgi:hypothetical protein